MAYLLLVNGSEPQPRFPLHPDRTVLGRDLDCQIVINETMMRRDAAADRIASVSRRHAIISHMEGGYYIEDGDGRGHRSRNGTYVNDQRAPFPERVLLHNHDRIRICDFVCTFHDELESSFSVEVSIDRDSSSESLQSQPADKLRVILDISNSLSHTLEIDSLLPLIIDSLFQLFQHAERGFIILRDETSGQLVRRVSRTRHAGDDPNAAFSHFIVRQCLEKIKAILGNDLPQQFPDSDSIGALPIRSLMCAPLWSQDGQPLGVIQLDCEGARKKFSAEDLNLLMGVASQASIALSNARLHRDALIHQARVRDLELASEVQRALLPQRLPDISGYDFYTYYESAQEVGGDYYDFVSLPQQRLAVLLGDVAGKGVAAALVMAKFSVEARACLLSEPEPAAAVSKLNALMNPAALANRFVTLVVAVLDPTSHAVALVNAGHPSPLLFRRAGATVDDAVPVDVAGPPVGISEGQAYGCRLVQLQPGDGLILYSDGVSEAPDVQAVQFGSKGIRGAIRGGQGSAREMGERVIRAMKQHAAGCRQNDDVTVVCFARAGS